MELNEKTAQETLAKINARCAPFTCPMCKKVGNFHFSKSEYQHLGFQRMGNMVIADGGNIDFVPVLAGCCPNCGFVATFNLKILEAI